MKMCGSCQQEKTDECFSKKGIYLQSYCKQCNKEHKQKWIKNNRDKVRLNSLWSDYRLRPEQYNLLLNSQNNRCAICVEEFTKSPHVDHDHSCCPQPGKSCGKCIRGLLCSNCNKMLGAYEYMLKFNTLKTYLKPHSSNG